MLRESLIKNYGNDRDDPTNLAAKKDIGGGYAEVGGVGSFLGGNPEPIGMWATLLSIIGRIPGYNAA